MNTTKHENQLAKLLILSLSFNLIFIIVFIVDLFNK